MNRKFDKIFGTDFIKTVPEAPGVYIFRNMDNGIIYVGKSKNLKKRLSQYRNANRKKRHRKMRAVIKNAVSVEHQICTSEKEALLLENGLIQEHKPVLNVSGVYYFLYPYMGIAWNASHPTWLGICYTTSPDEFKETPFNLFGAYRSRIVVGEAYRSLNTLLKYFAHKDHRETRQYRDFSYSSVSFYRQVDKDLHKGLTALFRGESQDGLGAIAKILLEKPDAGKKAAQIQDDLNNLMLFYKKEAKKLRLTLDKLGISQSCISQDDRDKLFIMS